MRRPQIVTALPGPKTQALLARDQAVLSTSYMRPYGFAPDHGQGVWLTDPDGNTFLDFMAGIAVATTGYNHPQVTQAIQRQAEQFLHICLTDYPQETTTRLAERLIGHVAQAGEQWRIFFGNSGAEAVEAAIKLSRNHSGRPYILSFLGAFHGRTYGALTLTASKAHYKRGFAPMLPAVAHVPYPNMFRPPLGATPETCSDVVLAHLESLFAQVIPADEVAAIIIEPFQGEGGYLIPPSDFLPRLRQICDKHGIILIFDEVQSGIGRSGLFCAYQHYPVQPDIVLLAKGLASGMPISAMLAKNELMTWKAGSHGSTFGGNPVSAAAALATLDVLEAGLLPQVQAVGELLMHGLRSLQQHYPMLGDVRGRGLFIGLEFVQANGDPAAKWRDHFGDLLFAKGVLNLPCGNSSIRFSPPLILSPEEAQVGLELIAETLADMVASGYEIS